MLIMGEIHNGLDMGNSSAESIENFNDTRSILHGDDSKLILFVDPDKERLGFVMEDTSSGWPVSVKVASSQESVSLFKEEMVINELLLSGGVHTVKWVESSLKVTFECIASSNNFCHDFVSLSLGNTRTERVLSQVSSNSDSS